MKRFRNSRKKPTSVALDEKTIEELKFVAEKQGIPYQVLIRVFLFWMGLSELRKYLDLKSVNLRAVSGFELRGC